MRAGGFVPMLQAGGYEATGVDPAAPPGPWYVQEQVEQYGIGEPGPRDRGLRFVASRR